MHGSQVLNKRAPFGPGSIVQSECSRNAPVEHHDAFESTRHRRKIIGTRNLLRREFTAAGDLNLMTGDRSPQSVTGRLAYLGGLLKVKPFLLRLCENCPGQRMFRVEFKTRRESENFLLHKA